MFVSRRLLRITGAVLFSGVLACLTAAGPGGRSTGFLSVVHAASCYGDSCNGQYAGATGCFSDAITINHDFTANGNAEVEKRYSAACNAVWPRITVVSGGSQFLQTVTNNYTAGTGYPSTSTSKTNQWAGRMVNYGAQFFLQGCDPSGSGNCDGGFGSA